MLSLSASSFFLDKSSSFLLGISASINEVFFSPLDGKVYIFTDFGNGSESKDFFFFFFLSSCYVGKGKWRNESYFYLHVFMVFYN